VPFFSFKLALISKSYFLIKVCVFSLSCSSINQNYLEIGIFTTFMQNKPNWRYYRIGITLGQVFLDSRAGPILGKIDSPVSAKLLDGGNSQQVIWLWDRRLYLLHLKGWTNPESEGMPNRLTIMTDLVLILQLKGASHYRDMHYVHI